ncbi:MAG: helix-turn-helix domain-containing protein [Isosphaeraceae bacterium]
MTNVSEPTQRGQSRKTKGEEIVEGLRELVAALKAGEPLESRFTVRRYKIAPPPEYRGEGVRRVRELLAMSQAAFGAFLGADPSTVRSWEQGLRPPSPLACRLLSEIEADPAHWRKRLAACLVDPETVGPDIKPKATPRPARRGGRNLPGKRDHGETH